MAINEKSFMGNIERSIAISKMAEISKVTGEVTKLGEHDGVALFSSPCLGILFSRQAWGAPRGGLSIALLRRGFPIDWNSHYFHPLTYCFLRFHAYRRGFLLL